MSRCKKKNFSCRERQERKKSTSCPEVWEFWRKDKCDYGFLLLHSSLGYFLRTSIDRDTVGVASVHDIIFLKTWAQKTDKFGVWHECKKTCNISCRDSYELNASKEVPQFGSRNVHRKGGFLWRVKIFKRERFISCGQEDGWIRGYKIWKESTKVYLHLFI